MTELSQNQLIQKKVILVVDDDESIRSTLVDALSMVGYSVLQAQSGLSALKILDKQPVDLVLSDVEMTEGDGFFLLKEIQSRKSNSPVIFISGHAEISADSVKRLGAVDLLKKPFDISELFRIVSTLVAKN